jgi:transcriptional regulator with XRE-family HTH domain
MNPTLQTRIKDLISLLRLTPQEFCEKMEIQRSSLSHLLSGRNKPGFDFLEKLLVQFPHINMEWLIHGIGEPIKSQGLKEDYTDVTKQNFTSVKSKSTVSDSEDVVQYRKLMHEKVANVEIKIQKVIVIYEDNTFEVFNSK